MCREEDIIVDGEFRIKKDGIRSAMAKITQIRKSKLSRTGNELRTTDDATHSIEIRSTYGVEYTNSAWIYEHRLRSSPRWFKVNGILEDVDFTAFSVVLSERGDQVAEPSGSNMVVNSLNGVLF
jgi:hypothetical protein